MPATPPVPVPPQISHHNSSDSSTSTSTSTVKVSSPLNPSQSQFPSASPSQPQSPPLSSQQQPRTGTGTTTRSRGHSITIASLQHNPLIDEIDAPVLSHVHPLSRNTSTSTSSPNPTPTSTPTPTPTPTPSTGAGLHPHPHGHAHDSLSDSIVSTLRSRARSVSASRSRTISQSRTDSQSRSRSPALTARPDTNTNTPHHSPRLGGQGLNADLTARPDTTPHHSPRLGGQREGLSADHTPHHLTTDLSAVSTWWNTTDIIPRPWREVQSPVAAKNAKNHNAKNAKNLKVPIPSEQVLGWESTKERVAKATSSILGTTTSIAHETLLLSVDVLEFVPVVGLQEAARTLLGIWDALQAVETNRLACLRLTSRCADILLAIRQEVKDAGDEVGKELEGPVGRLDEAFNLVHTFLQKQIHRPFLKRYLKREEILKQIAGCDAALGDSLGMFSLSIQIRILKQVQDAEVKRRADTEAILDSIARHTQSHIDDTQIQTHNANANALMLTGVEAGGIQTGDVSGLPPSSSHNSPSLAYSLPSLPTNTSSQTIHIPSTTTTTTTAPHSSSSPSTLTPAQIQARLKLLHSLQNESDAAHDMADLRQLMRSALGTSSDVEMIQVLQVGREEMPEAIKTLQRALERVVEAESTSGGGGSGGGSGSGSGGDGSTVAGGVGGGEKKTERKASVSTAAGAGVSVGAEGIEALDLAGGAYGLRRSGTVESMQSWHSSISSLSGKAGTVRDTLDREFIESGIDALRRVSDNTADSLPSWTITRYEVTRETKIGMGFFSDVYKGTWGKRTVAIKYLAPTTPRELFVREVEIWKQLKHPHVLELYGASSTSGEPPWFFVSPYEKNGSLVQYLKGKEGGGGAGGGGGENGVDLMKMMLEVAKGMEYLHSQGVLHGDLKAANVLVDDRGHCVISDFGQSEMKSEAYRISGTAPPHGTLRWQAPELMSGHSQLTTEMDVYSFAICCIEILTMGKMPWPLMDDDAVRHFVLKDNTRPPIPRTRWATYGLQELVRLCWHRDPFMRPSFSKVVRELKQLRKNSGTVDDIQSPQITDMMPLEWPSRPSPDMRPIPLPMGTPPRGEGGGFVDLGIPFPGSSPDTVGSSYRTAREPSRSPTGPPFFQRVEDTVATTDIHMPEPVLYTASVNPSRASSIFVSSSSSESEGDFVIPPEYDGYDSPPPANELIADMRNERRYRMLLTHEFHPSLTLPLWSPTPIALGAVGYLSKPSGSFIPLFDALNPDITHAVKGMPPLTRFTKGSQRQEKRNAMSRGLDAIAGFLTFRNRGDTSSSQTISRRFSWPLRIGHKTAYMYTESTVYRYIEDLSTPKEWFKANIDIILKTFGHQHRIQKEDVFLVIGTLDAPDYALFVSHNHPDGQVHFNVFSSPRDGQPWGMFTTDTDISSGPSYHEPVHGEPLSASKVSNSGEGPDTVLIARLRFKPDVLEPTSL